MHPACPRNEIIYKTACSKGPKFWVRKTFSKPASLQRASLVARPVAISHKVSLKPNHYASATPIQKTSKNQPKHGPKMDRLAVSFLVPHAQLSKRTKEKHFHALFFGTAWLFSVQRQVALARSFIKPERR